MTDVTDIQYYRDGGTVEFRVSGSSADGFYRLPKTELGTREPLFKEGQQLDFGSPEEVAVLAVLREWLDAVSTDEVSSAMAELDNSRRWHKLPEHVFEVLPIYRVRTVIQRLSERCG